MYWTVIKALLGVRPQTANDLSQIQIGLPYITARIRDRQHKFMIKILTERQHMNDDPIMKIWHLCNDAKTPGAKYLTAVMHDRDRLLITI